MADKFKVKVEFSYHTLAELEDDDLGTEVLNMIRQRRGPVAPETPEQKMLKKAEERAEKAETENYMLRQEIGKLTKAVEGLVKQKVAAESEVPL